MIERLSHECIAGAIAIKSIRDSQEFTMSSKKLGRVGARSSSEKKSCSGVYSSIANLTIVGMQRVQAFAGCIVSTGCGIYREWSLSRTVIINTEACSVDSMLDSGLGKCSLHTLRRWKATNVICHVDDKHGILHDVKNCTEQDHTYLI